MRMIDKFTDKHFVVPIEMKASASSFFRNSFPDKQILICWGSFKALANN